MRGEGRGDRACPRPQLFVALVGGFFKCVNGRDRRVRRE